MNKFINLLLLYLIVSYTVLFANDNIFINAKVAIPLIEKNDIQFLAVQESKQIIKGSKIVNIKLLSSTTVLGKMPCTPFYACTPQVEKYFSSLGMMQDSSLILYDNSYGVYASTLYTILESMGHKNITILDGGIKAVEQLDPNQKLYDKYQNELKASKVLTQDNNSTLSTDKSDSIESNLLKKMEMIKPHLLIEKKLNFTTPVKSDYVIQEQNSDYLLSTKDLRNIVKKVQSMEANITIVDACPMIDIVGNRYGSYLSGVTSFSWKRLINIKENRLKSKELLETIFTKMALKKDEYNYIYCMSESSKALFMMLVMRELGYIKVKAYTGDWSVWTGEANE